MKKQIKLIISILLFCLLFIGCGKFFRYILIDDTKSYTRVMIHEMYEQDNIDILFVGSSHCYRSFIPEILDREIGENTFNCGTSAQKLDGSYALIKEASKKNDIKRIYLELYYDCAFDVPKERTQLTQTYIISDYLKPSLNKLSYLINASGKEHYSNSFIVARRRSANLYDLDSIKNIITKKRSTVYKEYKYDYLQSKNEWYAGKGYVANNEIIQNWNYYLPVGYNKINTDKISDDWKKTLDDIISFCKKKDIELIFVVAPMSNYLLCGASNYDEYINIVKSICNKHNIEYYDFNLCKEEFFPNTSELFKDEDHLNCYGAELFSQLFADFVNNKISKEDLFYTSYQEKLDNLSPTVFGVSYKKVKNDGTTIKQCKIVNNSSDLEYKISMKTKSGKEYIIQDYSSNSEFTLPTSENGKCTINYRQKNKPETETTVIITIDK